MTEIFYNLINSKKKYIYMNFEFEHAFIGVLVLALLYYVYSHHSLLGDLMSVPHDNNPHLKAVKEKHTMTWLAQFAIWR